MIRDSSFLQYMRAHGNTPGPTQRPLLTGAVAGSFAAVPYEIVLHFSGARMSISSGFGINPWISLGVSALLMVVAGVLYAAIFRRAANDFNGGWLFGASYGFLLWMVGPITVWQLVTAHPIAVGRAAMGLFAGHVLYGIALGLTFPWVHSWLETKLENDGQRGDGSEESVPLRSG
jgi:hypothetical protein